MDGETGAHTRPALRHVMELRHVSESATTQAPLTAERFALESPQRHDCVIPTSVALVGFRFYTICKYVFHIILLLCMYMLLDTWVNTYI